MLTPPLKRYLASLIILADLQRRLAAINNSSSAAFSIETHLSLPLVATISPHNSHEQDAMAPAYAIIMRYWCYILG